MNSWASIHTALMSGLLLTYAPGGPQRAATKWATLDASRWADTMACASQSELHAVPRSAPDGTVTVNQVTGLRSDHQSTAGPQLPFDPGPEFAVRAHWTTVGLQDGWFVGRDKGEWGGGLWWFPSFGAPEQLIAENVWAIKRGVKGAYVVVLGEADVDEGTLIPLARETNGAWTQTARFRFPGIPSALHDAGEEGVYLMTSTALIRWTGEEMRVVAVGLEPVYRHRPFSIATDGTSVYVGMSLVWFRVNKDGGTPVWFMPSECRRFKYVDETVSVSGVVGTMRSCVCNGP